MVSVTSPRIQSYSRCGALVILAFVVLLFVADESRLLDKPGSSSEWAVETDKASQTEGEAFSSELPSETRPSPIVRPTLHLIGERHTGTKWITSELERCFNRSVVVSPNLTRWKHWFQANGTIYQTPNAVVVLQIRNVYDWMTAMHDHPYHSPDHFHLDWQSFLTTPWTFQRAVPSEHIVNQTHPPPCQCEFWPGQILPCHAQPYFRIRNGLVKALYEMRPDGTPYDNILQLRAAKIRNHLQLGSFVNVSNFIAVRYEDMAQTGTASLIGQLEDWLGVSAHCQPAVGKPLTRKRPFIPAMIHWLDEHVDWEAEAMVGYQRGDFAE